MVELFFDYKSPACIYPFSFVECRPGRLTDGPYTSYDLNTLLKATAGDRRCDRAMEALALHHTYVQDPSHNIIIVILTSVVILRLVRAVQLVLSDRLAAETSRVSLAEAVVQSLACGPEVLGKKISVGSIAGTGPGADPAQWKALFAGAQP